MRNIAVLNSLSLDGVMQAPGHPDEDRRDGFAHGGWAQPYNDEVMGQVMGEGMAKEGALLFGRRTYENFAGYWPNQRDNPFTPVLNSRTKYVVSKTLEDPLPWVNSVLLKGDAEETVARLKEEPGDDLMILGSGELIRSLARRDLIDTFTLLIHPLLLGTGRRLFADDGALAALRLVSSVTTTKGVIIATYQRDEAAKRD